MNLHDLNKIYLEAIATYKNDPSLTSIQINLIFKDPIFEKKIAVINADFRPLDRQIKSIQKTNINPYCKPQIKEKNGKYSF